ncbi:phage/plasmid primase, P4 family [Streptococcus jiangjianxini]|uniref:phage/plasmid primase, P4 family n=1 Tax=Streptococcus jiangjianxini TaxID=3161189 RepID=UPI0032EAB8ED
MTELDWESITRSLPEQKDNFLTSLNGIKGQIGYFADRVRQDAYESAYQAYLNKASVKKRIAEALDRDTDGITTRDVIEEEAKEHAKKAYAKAISKQPASMAKFLMEYIRFVRIKPVNDNQEPPLCLYDPDKGIYLENNVLIKDLITVINDDTTERKAKDVLYMIARNSTIREINDNYVALGNGLLNCQTMALEPYNPSVIVTRRIDYPYNADRQEPTINGWKPTEWLKSVLDDDDELFDLAIQILKSVVTGKTLERLFWLQGKGGSGKGSFQQIIADMVGESNIASLKVDELDGMNRFGTSALIGKSVVIGDDVQKDVRIKNTSTIFSLVTGDPLKIEEKGKTPYTLRLRLPVVQSSNGFPKMEADKGAITRRFVVVPFKKAYQGKPNRAIKNDYLRRSEVLEYFLKLAIETPWQDIEAKASQEALANNIKDSEPIVGFVESFFTDELESTFLPNEFVWYIWGFYTDYYKVKDYTPSEAFHKEVKANLPRGWESAPYPISIGINRSYPRGFFPDSDTPFYANRSFPALRKENDKRKNVSVRGYKLKKS